MSRLFVPSRVPLLPPLMVALVLAVCLAPAAAAAGDGSSTFCPPYRDSPLYRQRSRQLAADPGNWSEVIKNAQDGDEILLADGVYFLESYATEVRAEITIRSASGDRDAVKIQGRGYGIGGEAFSVFRSNVTLAELSISRVRNHAIHLQGGNDGLHVYNVHLFDIGTQHIKGSSGGSRNGVIACSKIGFETPAVGDYLNGIDLHQAHGWVIRDNEIHDIWGDGTGCEVDDGCDTYWPGGGPAILLWNNSSYNVVERNTIRDCYRGIAIGFGTTYEGGAVRNNFIYRSVASRPSSAAAQGREGVQDGVIPGDMGIRLENARGTTVDHNTVILAGDYPGSIELRDSAGVLLRNNLLSTPVDQRGSSYNDCDGGLLGGRCDDARWGNRVDATSDDLARAGSYRLAASSAAIDSPLAIVGVSKVDIEGRPRPQGERPDLGCYEAEAASKQP